MEIKVGDTVVCIEQTSELVEGNSYTVTSIGLRPENKFWIRVRTPIRNDAGFCNSVFKKVKRRWR